MFTLYSSKLNKNMLQLVQNIYFLCILSIEENYNLLKISKECKGRQYSGNIKILYQKFYNNKIFRNFI